LYFPSACSAGGFSNGPLARSAALAALFFDAAERQLTALDSCEELERSERAGAIQQLRQRLLTPLRDPRKAVGGERTGALRCLEK
jgi:hypothetical protein